MTQTKSLSLEREYKYYLDNRDWLIKEYGSDFIVIKGNEVLGAHKTQDQALKETLKAHSAGTFLVQQADSPIKPHVFQRASINVA